MTKEASGGGAKDAGSLCPVCKTGLEAFDLGARYVEICPSRHFRRVGNISFLAVPADGMEESKGAA